MATAQKYILVAVQHNTEDIYNQTAKPPLP